jgi:hypothetical protein
VQDLNRLSRAVVVAKCRHLLRKRTYVRGAKADKLANAGAAIRWLKK